MKSNIGHPEAAGGLAGLIKTALVVRNRRVPATVHCPNPTSAEWPSPGRALAGVSTYGLSGTFVHLVVGEIDDVRAVR
ncbi:hypothetical protein ACIA5G_17625 [Amycolatopsis sp. NPDC051758]|uniref:hypothetical protein n=1 Tax=Amycolatopsis sp. NPDC051758 TaxID=3363935 RepID=UPI0037AC87E9